MMKACFSNIVKIGLAAGTMCLSIVNGYSWGQKGHDVTCAIAQNHLSKKAQKRINNLLDGKSIVYWANWMDNASHTPEYAYTSTWHYKNIDANETYEGAVANPKGDVIVAVNDIIAAFKSGKLSREEQILNLKFLVHLVGDIHCPMHMAHKSDRGGNKWQVQYFGSGKNLHSVWDSGVIESARKWSCSEWVNELDRATKAQAAQIVAGTPEDWGRETFEIATKIYDTTPVGSKLSYDYVSEWSPVLEQQLLRGGLRLASVLNEIFR